MYWKGNADLLFYNPYDDNWWLGSYGTNNQINWTFVGNTKGFGHAIDKVMKFWTGDFNGDGKTDVLLSL